jgi:hypothetical protein
MGSERLATTLVVDAQRHKFDTTHRKHRLLSGTLGATTRSEANPKLGN